MIHDDPDIADLLVAEVEHYAALILGISFYAIILPIAPLLVLVINRGRPGPAWHDMKSFVTGVRGYLAWLVRH